MSSADAQKSEIHDETADASTSPAAAGDVARRSVATDHEKPAKAPPKDIPASAAQTIIISDESEDGGPLVIQSQEPSLTPPQAPQEQFPTSGVADIDVVSDNARAAKLRPSQA